MNWAVGRETGKDLEENNSMSIGFLVPLHKTRN